MPRKLLAILLLACSLAAAQAQQPDVEIPASGKVKVSAKGGLLFDGAFNSTAAQPILFDTGSVNLLSFAMVRKLGLTVDSGHQTFHAIGGNIQSTTTAVATLRIGELVLHNVPFHVIDMPPAAEGAPAAVLGYELLTKLIVQVDFERQRITFLNPATFTPRGHGTRVPLHVDGQNLELNAVLDGVPGLFLIDTGNEIGLSVAPAFVQQHDLIQRLHAKYSGYSGRGYGGPSPPAYYARVRTFELGPAKVESVIARLSTGAPTQHEIAGNIGQNVLREFTVTFDYNGAAMYLEPNSTWGKPQVFNRAGLIADPNPGGEEVMTILPNSPAAAAGLQAGDLITRIDNRAPADTPDDPAFLQAAGTEVHLTVERKGQPLKITLTLRDIL
jgi:hypothetical protein